MPAYLATLLFILSVALGERVLFGARSKRRSSAYGRAFAAAFPALFLVASGVPMWFGEKAALRQAPGALIAPLLAAVVPFAAAGAAVLPAAVVAGPAGAAGQR